MLIVAGKPESGPVDIQLPRSSSLWVANGKVRKVLFSHRGEQTVNTWRTDILQANGDVTVQGKEEILFPVSGSSMRNYEMSLAVPPTLETGKYMVRVCASVNVLSTHAPVDEKQCTHSCTFHIEGTTKRGNQSFPNPTPV